MDTASSDMIDTSKKHNMYLLLVLTVLVLSSGGLAEPGGAEKAAAPKPEDQQFLVIVTRQAYATPRAFITASLVLADWPLNKVIFVYSGSRNDSMQLNHYGGMNVYTRRRLFEYVAFLVPTLMHEINAVAASYYLGQNPQFMLLHDTMLVGGKFTALSRPLFKRAIDEQCDVLWLSPWGQANICIFSSHASAHIHDVFRYNMTMDKDTATKMEMSGVAGVDHPYSIKHLKALRQCRVGELSYETGSKKVYSAIQRISVYFPAADLVKFYVDTLRSGAVHPNQP